MIQVIKGSFKECNNVVPAQEQVFPSIHLREAGIKPAVKSNNRVKNKYTVYII